MWDFEYQGDGDSDYNDTDSSSLGVTVGQEDQFVYKQDRYLEDNEGLSIAYGQDWDKNLPREYRYLREILGAGNISNGSKIYLPPPATVSGTPVHYDYPVRFRVNDTDGDIGEKLVILRVLPFAKHTFSHDIEDEYGNPLEAKATLTWRGHFDDAAPDKGSISDYSPVFVYINTTGHPVGYWEDGDLGIYYEIGVVGTFLQNRSAYGFCDLVVNLPYKSESLEEVGIVEVLEQRVKVYYWQLISRSFNSLETSVTKKGSTYVATAIIDDDTVLHNSPLTPLVYSLYENIDKAELVVEDLLFSRSPVFPGEPVEIAAKLYNTGVIHANDVQIRFSVNSVQFHVDSIDLPAGITEPVSFIVEYNVSEQIMGRDKLTFSALVDPHGNIRENNESNNLYEEELFAVSSVGGGAGYNTPNGNMSFEGSDPHFYVVDVNYMESHGCGVGSAEYFLVTHKGTTVNFGKVSDIYGLVIEFPGAHVNITFQDNDIDGKISAGDRFLIRKLGNDGICGPGYKLTIKFYNDKVVMKQNTFNEYELEDYEDDWDRDEESFSVDPSFLILAFILLLIILVPVYQERKRRKGGE